MRLKLSARKSDLARLQAYMVGEAIQKNHPHIEIQYLFRESLGDQNQEDPLWKMPAKGVFTEDFKSDLMTGRTDMVVHSWKDLPTDLGGETVLAATLKRADSRDLLLYKNTSFSKKKPQIYSSSPRREHNLSRVLPQILPFEVQDLQFCVVRGNIQTRVRKLLENPEIDGLIVAKAAMDRLLNAEREEFQGTREFLKKALLSLHWMVLPLSENPPAAAQGALAVEIHKSRKDLIELLSGINCEKSYQEAETERKILKEFGGGCHLALGMSHQKFRDFEVTFVRGLDPQGNAKLVRSLKMHESVETPSFQGNEKWSSGELIKHRIPAAEVRLNPQWGYVISRFDSWPSESVDFTPPLWAAGFETWKKLAKQGLWVLGCHEGLGSDQTPPVESYLPNTPWKVLTHHQNPQLQADRHICTYRLEVSGLPPDSAQYFFWRSASDFLHVVQKRPEILNCHHACGPGSTYEYLKDKIEKKHLKVFLSEEDWRNDE